MSRIEDEEKSVFDSLERDNNQAEPFLKKHPKGLYVLFSVEMWERFSFYGMRGILILYMTKILMLADDKAFGIYGAYGALVYASPVLGGFLADKLLGYRYSIFLGGIIMMLGQLLLATPGFAGFEGTGLGMNMFYSGLALLAVGNGFFKPNISSLVGQLYPPGDPLRDRGFVIFYMGINLGAFLQLICGVVGEKFGFQYGFLVAAIGMFAGLLNFALSQSAFGNKGLPPGKEGIRIPPLNIQAITIVGAVVATPVFAFLILNNDYVGFLLPALAAVVLGYILYVGFSGTKEERERIFVVITLLFFSTLFWAFFEQAGSSVSLFTDRNVDRVVFGGEIPASAFQSVNPLFIVGLGVVFNMLWSALSKRNAEPNTPVKFALGILQLGLGFIVYALGEKFANDGLVPLVFLIGGYLLHTTGELCLSPVGLSMVTKLAPARIAALMMGTWFLSSAFAHYLGGIIAKLTAVPHGGGEGGAVDKIAGLAVYTDVFWKIGIASVLAGVLLVLISPVIKKWMHGVS